MKKKLFTVIFALIVTIVAFNSCNGNKSENQEEATEKVDNAAFNETQPVHSGLYDANYYNITGTNPRKGQFDGRVFFSLSPEMSAIYVFENGNRTKIDNTITLKHPFEKNDSGVYISIDQKDRTVCIYPDSTHFVLSYQYSGDTLNISFNSKARYEGSPLEILEKITAQKKKDSTK